MLSDLKVAGKLATDPFAASLWRHYLKSNRLRTQGTNGFYCFLCQRQTVACDKTKRERSQTFERSQQAAAQGASGLQSETLVYQLDLVRSLYRLVLGHQAVECVWHQAFGEPGDE